MSKTTKKVGLFRLLLATSNPELQIKIEQLLQAEDIQIFQAAETSEVFDKMSRCLPQLVLADLDMPGLQERDLLQEKTTDR